MKAEIERTLVENDNEEVGTDILWDTLKTVLRGEIISYCSRKKKERRPKWSELNSERKELEIKHKEDPKPDLAVRLKEIRK